MSDSRNFASAGIVVATIVAGVAAMMYQQHQQQTVAVQWQERNAREIAKLREAAAQDDTPAKFEYRLSSPRDADFEKQCNALGSEGWELVYARRARGGILGDEMLYETIWRRQLAGGARRPASTASGDE